jgi:hypothetical protein
VLRDLQEHKEHKEHKESQALRVSQEHKAPTVFQALLVLRVLLAFKVRKEHKE